MALDFTAQGLWNEIRKAKEHRDSFLQGYEGSIGAYVGPGYRGGSQEPDFDNHAYKYLSIFLPLLASGNPRIRTKTPRQGSAAALARAIQFGVNRNFELQNLKRTIEQLATDWFFKYCVAMTTARPVMGLLEREDPPYRPVTRRLSLLDYAWDPVAIQHSEARYQAHRIIRDLDSLQREAEEAPNMGWRKDVIGNLTLAVERDMRGEKLSETYDRDEVEYWEIWVPEAELEKAKDERGRKFVPNESEGFHGTIYTVSQHSYDELRDPRPFWGPRDGPYTFSGYLPVPDRVVDLSPLAANSAQQEVNNSVWAAAVESIRSHKKGVAVSSDSAADLAEKIAEFRDLGVFTVEAMDDIDKAMREIELGGITAQHLQMLQILRFNLEQSSGLTEASMGQASGASTATESSIAQMSSNKRMAYMAEKFTSAVVKPIASNVAWNITMHPLSRFPLGPEAEGIFHDDITGEPIEMPVLAGGARSADLMEDMDIEVEAISMRATNELLEAELSAQQDAWLTTIAPMIPQMPWVEWDQVIARKAEQWRDPSWARVINVPKAMMVGQMMMQINLQGIPGGIQQPQPRLGADLKAFQGLKSSETPAGFSSNARPSSNAARGGQIQKGPRDAGASKTTKATPSKGS